MNVDVTDFGSVIVARAGSLLVMFTADRRVVAVAVFSDDRVQSVTTADRVRFPSNGVVSPAREVRLKVGARYLVMRAAGMTMKQIARERGVSECSVWRALARIRRTGVRDQRGVPGFPG